MRVRDGGAWRDITSGRVRIDGAWRPLTAVRAYHDGAWRDVASFAPAMTVSITPSLITETLGSTSPILVTTNAATATPSGGTGPYSYVWARQGAGEGSANSPTSATTTFSRVVNPGENHIETFRCTVTDALGNTAFAESEVGFGNTGVDPF